MSKSNRNRGQCPATEQSFVTAKAGSGPACSTYNSARMPHCSMADNSMSFHNQEHCGRSFNPLLDTTKARLARAENAQFYSPNRRRARSPNSYVNASEIRRARDERQHLKQFLQNTRSTNLKGEMACDAPTQVQIANAARKHQQLVMTKDQCQPSRQQLATAYKKLAQDYINTGHQKDLDQLQNNNMLAFDCPGRTGRPMDLERDLTYHRLNLPTPKKQRARSCPGPLNGESTQSYVQRMLKECQRPAQHNSSRPSRSMSPPEARYIESPGHQTSKRSLQKRADNLAKPVATSARSQRYTSESPGTLTNIATTTTTSQIPSSRRTKTPPLRSPQRPTDRPAAKAPPGLFRPQIDATPRQKSQHNLNVSQDYSPQLDMEYGQTPTGTTTRLQYTLKTPTKPANETEQITNTILNQTEEITSNTQREKPSEQESVVTEETIANRMLKLPRADNSVPVFDSNSETIKEMQRIYQSRGQNVSTPTDSPSFTVAQAHPQEKSFPYNGSRLDDFSQYGRSTFEDPSNSFVDETLYVFDDMDISIQSMPFGSPYPIPSQLNSKERCWKILPEDLTCIDHSNVSRQTSLPSSTMPTHVRTISATCPTLDKEPDSTQYLELPSKLKASCSVPRCEQPKPTPLRSRAVLQEQVADQTAAEMCDTWTFGTPVLCSTSRFGDMQYGLRDLFDMPHNQGVEELPTSIKECANAKRCGYVQFDSSDKRELLDPQRRARRLAEIENLVNDTYCPGIIQETVDGLDNFNKYSFNAQNSGDDPMTLLEAFSMRIDKERADVGKNIKEDFTKEQITESINQHFAKQNPNDLNRAIKSFLLCEQLQDHEEIEKAKSNSFEADIQKWATVLPGATNIKLISYTGRTRPTKANDILN